MGIEKTLKKEIAETDKFIAGLGPEGKSFLDQLAAIDMHVAPLPDDSPHQAAYDMEDNIFYCPLGLPLSLRFNFRVHEGAHAVQARAIGALSAGRLNAPMAITLDGVIKFARTVEQNAHGVQAYFNAIAVQKTGNSAFVDDLDIDSSLNAYRNAISESMRAGMKPLAVGRAVARSFLGHIIQLPVAGMPDDFRLDMKQGELLDMLSLSRYETAIEKRELAEAGQQDFSRDEYKMILNAVVPLDASDVLLSKLDGPVKLAPSNRKTYRTLREQLARLNLE